MYKCDNPRCGAEFEEPATRKEYHNEIEGDFYELLPCCPQCGCEDYSEIEDEDEEIEDEEIEDEEIDIESFQFIVQVRYFGYATRTMRNAYFYAGDTKGAESLVEKYSRYKGVKVIRVYELRSEVKNE